MSGELPASRALQGQGLHVLLAGQRVGNEGVAQHVLGQASERGATKGHTSGGMMPRGVFNQTKSKTMKQRLNRALALPKWPILEVAIIVATVALNLHVKRKLTSGGKAQANIEMLSALAADSCSSNWCLSPWFCSATWTVSGGNAAMHATNHNKAGSGGFDFDTPPSTKCTNNCNGFPDTMYTTIIWDDAACACGKGFPYIAGVVSYQVQGVTNNITLNINSANRHHAEWQIRADCSNLCSTNNPYTGCNVFESAGDCGGGSPPP
jgi:hypothetical protein